MHFTAEAFGGSGTSSFTAAAAECLTRDCNPKQEMRLNKNCLQREQVKCSRSFFKTSKEKDVQNWLCCSFSINYNRVRNKSVQLTS